MYTTTDTLGKKSEKNLHIWNQSLNVEFQATSTTKLEFEPRMKLKKLNAQMLQKITYSIYFNYCKFYIIQLLIKVRTIRWTIIF